VSEQNVEIVRTMCDAFCAGDYPTALDLLDSEVEWHGTAGGLDEGQVFRGHSEVVAAFIDSAGAWESQILETTELIDADKVVVVFWHEIARGRESGAEVETETAVLYAVENGKIVRVTPFMDRAKALEAAGLSE
jgi:ketosteroid isomerase-like protein